MSQLRRAFTLIEMMIAMIITLMIVFAMVEAFRWVGETTTEGRAIIEMNGQIRGARFQLERDCANCTVRLVPAENGKGNDQGYFELVEGMGRDNRYDAANPLVPLALRFLDRGEAGGYDTCMFNDPNNAAAALHGSMFGDVDDVLAMTCHNDQEPYRGRLWMNAGPNNVVGDLDDVITIIESNDAEIIWWAELNDRSQDMDGDGSINPVTEGMNGEWDPGETFTIRRRVLLIRPDLNTPDGRLVVPFNDVDTYLINSDLSVRFYFDATNTPQGIAANSRGDLASRHNRATHQAIDFGMTNGAGVPRGLSTGGFMSPLNPTRIPAYGTPDLYGEDVVLTNVIGFDLRVWDPNAPVCGFAPDGGETPEGIVPGDPNFNATIAPASIVGRGAFVDLGALGPVGDAVADPISNAALIIASPGAIGNGIDDDGDGLIDAADPDEIAANPHFLGNMNAQSYLLLGTGLPGNGNFVYDTWAREYESDGYDQDGDGLVDEGTNGLDDLNAMGAYEFGPDDINERETLPPYNYPLKAIQVRIRVYESDTRQVRQMSQVVRFNQ